MHKKDRQLRHKACYITKPKLCMFIYDILVTAMLIIFLNYVLYTYEKCYLYICLKVKCIVLAYLMHTIVLTVFHEKNEYTEP